jgi:hypothetical protein
MQQFVSNTKHEQCLVFYQAQKSIGPSLRRAECFENGKIKIIGNIKPDTPIGRSIKRWKISEG